MNEDIMRYILAAAVLAITFLVGAVLALWFAHALDLGETRRLKAHHTEMMRIRDETEAHLQEQIRIQRRHIELLSPIPTTQDPKNDA